MNNCQSAPGQFLGQTHYVLSCDIHSGRPVVICIHGIGSFYRHFDALADHVTAAGYCVLRYDLIGRGYSTYPRDDNESVMESKFGAESHVKQLRDLVSGLNICSGKYHIIAHSMGGAIAALYASRYADEILSLSLLSPAGLMELPVVKLLRMCTCLHGCVKPILRSGQENAWREDFHTHKGEALEAENDMVSKLRFINNLYPTIFDAFWESVLQFPLYGLDVDTLAPQITVPVFIGWGEYDRAVPWNPSLRRWEHAFKTANHPSLTIKMYDNSGHAFFIENANLFHTDILTFISNSSTGKC